MDSRARETDGRPAATGSARVLLPDWRGPSNATAGIWASSSVSGCCNWRENIIAILEFQSMICKDIDPSELEVQRSPLGGADGREPVHP